MTFRGRLKTGGVLLESRWWLGEKIGRSLYRLWDPWWWWWWWHCGELSKRIPSAGALQVWWCFGDPHKGTCTLPSSSPPRRLFLDEDKAGGCVAEGISSSSSSSSSSRMFRLRSSRRTALEPGGWNLCRGLGGQRGLNVNSWRRATGKEGKKEKHTEIRGRVIKERGKAAGVWVGQALFSLSTCEVAFV